MRDTNGRFIKGCQLGKSTQYKKNDERLLGKNNPNWKGKDVGYLALHSWVVRKKGKARICEFCSSERKVEWANKSHQYKRDLNDWLSLCSNCHRHYDRSHWGIAMKKFPEFFLKYRKSLCC